MRNKREAFIQRLELELKALDGAIVEVNGQIVRPSDCYRLGRETGEIVFHKNCPDSLKERIRYIIDRN